ncbi:hypothetical protein G6M26_31220 [Agrobacterium tumefaciens]|nr:hypothetical protein [Agrobacterium tumefaciens]NTE23023.1 hypothetical protein [Agrobacterium tumefaciens]
MNKNTYDIFLDDIKIGTTELENADAPMGVVFGSVKLFEISSGYEFLKRYCVKNGIEIFADFPDDQLIATSNIQTLKIISSNGIEIKGQAVNINGMDSDVFEITVLGIPYPFFEKQFPHHVEAYKNQNYFKNDQ